MATQRRQLQIFIDGKAAEGTLKNIYTQKRKVSNELKNLVVGSEAYNKKVRELQKLDGHIRDHRNQLKQTEGTWSKMKGSIKGIPALMGVAFGADMIVSFGKELFKAGTEMEALGRKALIVFGDELPKVTAAAAENAHQMGLTRGQYVDAAAAIQDLLVPMGFQRQEATGISTELVNLSGALSQWTGGQKTAQEVSATLSKAMLGEREELKGLGIAISENDVTQRLAQKGLDKLTGATLQQAKAAATLELITEKSTDAQAAYASGSDTLIGKQAVLTAKLQEIKEAMATALIPVFHRLVEVAGPVLDTVVDTIDAFQKGEKQTTTFGKTIDILSTIFGALWQRLQIVGTFFSSFINLLSGDIPLAVQYAQLAFQRWGNALLEQFNTIADFVGLDFKLDIIDTKPTLDKIDELEKRIDATKENAKGLNTSATSPTTSPTAPGQPPTGAPNTKSADRAEKELERQQQRLNDILTKHRQAALEADMSEDERQLERIRQRYQKEIDLAAEMGEAGRMQKLELEQLLNDELNRARDEQIVKEMEQRQLAAEEEQLRKVEQHYADFEAEQEAKAEIEEFLAEKEMTARELALEALEEKYRELEELAVQHGIDKAAILKAKGIEEAKLEKEFRDKQLADEQAAFQLRIVQAKAGFQAVSDIVTNALDVIGAESTAALGLQKLLTIAQIGLNTASAISSVTDKAARSLRTGSPIEYAIKVAAMIGTVLGNIAKAKSVLSSVSVPQKFEGGWSTVTGQQDGRSYRAKYIGEGSTGMLSAPVLLAAERGPEYFVSNPDLRNPAVLNHVQAIENLTKGRRVRQFADGGFTEQAPSPAPAQDIGQLTNVLAALTSTLQAGIYARLTDDTVIDADERLNELRDVSGGTLN